ncbi:2-hydroxyacid dehydrogenase [Salinactinospora qingdaonensis]
MNTAPEPRPLRVAVYSSKPYDREYLELANREHGHDLRFLESRLTLDTAPLAAGHQAVCVFVNDELSAAVLEALAAEGVRLVALRSSGYNHVDLAAAAKLGITVTRVPDYSPHAVAEHCAGLVLALNRKIHRAYNRVRENNFALSGLLGFDLFGKTVGVVGTGRIGTCFARIMVGFGCRVLAADPMPNEECRGLGVEYVPLEELCARSDIVALHCPLTPRTHHLVDRERLAGFKPGAMLINTSRGALVDTEALIDALKSGRISHLALDVYEEEAGLFFEDRSELLPRDDLFARLLSFPNVLVTGHQGFFTREALAAIGDSVVAALTAFAHGETPQNTVAPPEQPSG